MIQRAMRLLMLTSPPAQVRFVSGMIHQLDHCRRKHWAGAFTLWKAHDMTPSVQVPVLCTLCHQRTRVPQIVRAMSASFNGSDGGFKHDQLHSRQHEASDTSATSAQASSSCCGCPQDLFIIKTPFCVSCRHQSLNSATSAGSVVGRSQ